MQSSILKTAIVGLCIVCIALPSAFADTIFNTLDVQGRKQGFWKKRYPNGKVAYTAFFVNNYVRGDLVRFHDNGKKMAVIHYFDGEQPAFAKLFSTTGALVAEGRYIKDGVKFGIWKYFKDGKASLQENYDSVGKMDGEQVSFYPTGKVFERKRFSHGLQTGLYEQIDLNGQPVVEMMYKDGKRNGKVRYYYSNNQIRIDGQYADNVRTGEWTFYDNRGKVERCAVYVDGVASDQDKIDAYQTEYLERMEKDKGRYKEPEDRFKDDY
ncbi:hypothetical protein FACS189456_2420 [Bacteroidia bacterium]|nr:hypothetical protein FACS189456_2420 [Bacteroidia bacterium]